MNNVFVKLYPQWIKNAEESARWLRSGEEYETWMASNGLSVMTPDEREIKALEYIARAERYRVALKDAEG